MLAEMPAFMQAEIYEQATSPSKTRKTPPGDALAASLTGTSKQHKLAKLNNYETLRNLFCYTYSLNML